MNAITLLAASFFLAADDPKGEMKNLEGTWIVVTLEADGKIQTAKELTGMLPLPSLKIAGNKIDALFGGQAARFSIDSKQNPKQMDVKRDEDTVTEKWIYSLDGDVLKLAVTFEIKLFGGEPDRSRPKSFATKDNKTIVFTLKREEK